MSGRALSPVKIKIPVATADMRRHSDTLRGAQRRRKRGLRGENNRTSFLRSKVVVFPSFFFVFPSYTKDIVFSRTCAGKRHPESRERGDRKGVNGGKREGERSEQESVVTRQNKDSRRVGGHAPPQRHLERSAATTKVGANGGENARASVLRSEGVCSPVYCCHAILITLTDISSPVAADSLHRLIIAPARAAAVLDSPVGGRLGLGSVGVMPSLVMTM